MAQNVDLQDENEEQIQFNNDNTTNNLAYSNHFEGDYKRQSYFLIIVVGIFLIMSIYQDHKKEHQQFDQFENRYGKNGIGILKEEKNEFLDSKIKQNLDEIDDLIQQKTDTNEKTIIQSNQTKSNNLAIHQSHKINEQQHNNKNDVLQSRAQAIFSGEMHPAKISFQYWQYNIGMLKSAGLNTIAVAIPWSHYQIKRGIFDFETEDRNLKYFLELSKKNQLKLLLMPGPYIGETYDYGGLPSRLLGIQQLQIRSSNKLFLEEVKIYFEQLYKVIADFLPDRGGNVKLIQIQNQLGLYSSDLHYMQQLVDIWNQLGVKNIFYYQQSISNWQTHFTGQNYIGLAQVYQDSDYKMIETYLASQNLKSKVFCSSLSLGQPLVWGQSDDLYQDNFQINILYLLRAQRQFSITSFAAGTNFGLPGAKYTIDSNRYEAIITSNQNYGILRQNGDETINFEILSSMMQAYLNKSLPVRPEKRKKISISPFRIDYQYSLFDLMKQPIILNSKQVYFFQHHAVRMYRQGLLIYKTSIPISSQSYQFTFKIHDFAMIFLDQQLVSQFNRSTTDILNLQVKCLSQTCQLKMIVESMGHYVNAKNQDIKGLISWESQPVIQLLWDIYAINLQKTPNMQSFKKNYRQTFPAILSSKFYLEQTGDTYFDISMFSKGYLFINDKSLGRFWNIGPQKKLYCPGVWLVNGQNTVIILDLMDNQSKQIQSFEAY